MKGRSSLASDHGLAGHRWPEADHGAPGSSRARGFGIRLLTLQDWALAIVVLDCAIVLALMFHPLFRSMARTWDYEAHITFARWVEQRGLGVTERPGFELMVLAAARLFPEGAHMLLAAIWVSVVATIGKFLISARLIGREVGPYASLALALVLLFAAPITLDWSGHPLRRGNSGVHLGQMSGLIVHNPTTVVVFPFVLLLFYFSFRERYVLSGVLAALQCFIKPNFVVAWLPVFGLLQVWRHRLDWKALATTALAVVPAAGVLLYQYAATERLGAGIIVAPFRAWNELSPNIVWSCVRSLAFPVAFCAVYFREIRGRTEIWFAWGIFAVAFIQYVLLYMPGAGYPGNWSWGRYLSIYIVFLLCLARFAAMAVRRESWQGPWRVAANALLVGLIALHVSSGFRYYVEGVRYARW